MQLFDKIQNSTNSGNETTVEKSQNLLAESVRSDKLIHSDL